MEIKRMMIGDYEELYALWMSCACVGYVYHLSL